MLVQGKEGEFVFENDNIPLVGMVDTGFVHDQEVIVRNAQFLELVPLYAYEIGGSRIGNDQLVYVERAFLSRFYWLK